LPSEGLIYPYWAWKDEEGEGRRKKDLVGSESFPGSDWVRIPVAVRLGLSGQSWQGNLLKEEEKSGSDIRP